MEGVYFPRQPSGKGTDCTHVGLLHLNTARRGTQRSRKPKCLLENDERRLCLFNPFITAPSSCCALGKLQCSSWVPSFIFPAVAFALQALPPTFAIHPAHRPLTAGL